MNPRQPGHTPVMRDRMVELVQRGVQSSDAPVTPVSRTASWPSTRTLVSPSASTTSSRASHCSTNHVRSSRSAAAYGWRK